MGKLEHYLLDAVGKEKADLSLDNPYRRIGFDEDKKRLGWVGDVSFSKAKEVLEELLPIFSGIDNFIFVGIGGSINGIKPLISLFGNLSFYTLDNLDPLAIKGILSKIDSLEKTLVVSNLDIVEVISHQISVFSLFSLTTIAIFIFIGLFMNFSRTGRYIYAIGGGRKESVAAGVPVFRTIVFVFMLSGALAGLAGSVVSLKSGSAIPRGLEGLLLLAAASALIGGTSLAGGQGSALGIALGVIIMRFVSNFINFRAMPYYMESLVTGVLLIFVIAMELIIGQNRVRGLLSRWVRRLRKQKSSSFN